MRAIRRSIRRWYFTTSIPNIPVTSRCTRSTKAASTSTTAAGRWTASTTEPNSPTSSPLPRAPSCPLLAQADQSNSMGSFVIATALPSCSVEWRKVRQGLGSGATIAVGGNSVADHGCVLDSDARRQKVCRFRDRFKTGADQGIQKFCPPQMMPAIRWLACENGRLVLGRPNHPPFIDTLKLAETVTVATGFPIPRQGHSLCHAPTTKRTSRSPILPDWISFKQHQSCKSQAIRTVTG